MVMAPPGRDDRLATQREPLRLGDTTPERREVEINGKHLKAWVVSNQRFPASIAAQLEDARQRWLTSRERRWNGPPPPHLIDTVRQVVQLGPQPDPEQMGLLLAALEQSLRMYDEEPQWTQRLVDWEAYVTTCLTTLIPRLEDWEAELLTADERFNTLVSLGWFAAPDEADGGALPPEEGPSSTGDEHAPDSVGSTT